jgi:hypothetical protein
VAFATKDINLVEEPIELTVSTDPVLDRLELIPSTVSIVEPFVNEYISANPLNQPKQYNGLPRNDAQTLAIVSQLDDFVFDDYTLIEVGAGKAKLAHQFVVHNKTRPPKRVYLIDRSRPRAKMDRKIENICGHTERIDCDLKDVDFTKIPLSTQGVVIVGKHACGEATCFSLVALAKAMNLYPEKHFYLSLAPCCHQVCNYNSFCNRDVVEKLSIDHTLFHHISRISSWSVCAIADDCLVGPHKKSEIGRLFKLFIDICRVKYLQNTGMNAHLRVYCDQVLSPENRVIVAHSRK